MNKEIISSPNAPKAIGPYSQAVRYGDLVFCSGAIPLDPATGKVVEGGIVEQARRAMDNLKAVLEEAGLTYDSVLKTTLFLSDMDDFKAANEVYGSYFSGSYPARSTVQVAKLPMGVRFEVEAIAGR